MSVAEARTDAKAGYSSWCRRGEHRTCSSVQARCGCSCHGRRGQQPPTAPEPAPPTKKEPAMNAATAEVTPLRPPPADVEHEAEPGGHLCPDCGRTFTEHGLSVHRARMHKNAKPSEPTRKAPAAKKAAPAKRGRPKLDAESVSKTLEDDYDPWLVVVGHLDGDGAKASTVVLATENDARQVSDLVTALGHRPRVFRLADGR